MRCEARSRAKSVNYGLVDSWWIRIAALAFWVTPVVAQDVGYEGPSFPTSVTTPTESKPESKLWFHDGQWWGSLWSAAGSAYQIHRLDFFTHAWVDAEVEIDTRANSHADVLWDGTKLYIASHRFSTTGSSSGNPIRLYRYSYDTTTDRYGLDGGFPVTIGDYSTEALTIGKDSTGTLWAAWTQSRRVRICHSLGSDTQWSTPIVLPRNTSSLDTDDICSLIRFGNRIGVLWSDQIENMYRFSFHVDGAPDTTWSTVEDVSDNEADDHLDLATDSAGRVFLVGKNLANNLLLYVRASGGGWTRHVVTNPTPILTRPIVLLNEEARRIHVFATGQDSGEVFEKTSSLDNISFGSGTGTIRMRDASTPFRISDPTSTKQNLTNASGLVVLAHHDTTGFYWHHEVVPPPTTDFLASPTGGVSPLSVAFTDRSIGPIGTRTWSFGDGGTSSATNPSHTYGPGTFTVSLTATGPGGTDTETKTGYIVVIPPPPVANFSAAPTSGFAPLAVAFTDASTGSITSRLWSFGDGGTSTATSPSHTYAAGTYTVSLTATGPGGADTETKTGYIVVVHPPPVANFTAAPTSGFAPLSVAFTDASTGPITSRLWSFGDGGTSTATNPSHTYAAGTYTVSLELTGPGGTDTETKTAFIVVTLPPPVANFSAAPTSGVAPLDVAFTDLSTGSITSRLWSFGDGGTSTATNPSHTYAVGIYTVSLTATGPGGADTETRAGLIVVTSPSPVANFTAAPTGGVAPLEVAFADASTGTITTRLWSFGDGGTSTATNPSHTYAAGTYTVSLALTGPGGTDIETKPDFIVVTVPPPVASFAAAPTSGVAPLDVAFTDASTGSIATRLWSFGDGGSSNAANPVHTYAPGTYTVSLTVGGPGGSDTETRTNLITVGEPAGPPLANFAAAPTSGVAPLSVGFTDASAGTVTSRLWSFGDGGTSSAVNPVHAYAAGTYTVSLTVTGPGGTDTETKPNVITVSGAPLALVATVETAPVPSAGDSADDVAVWIHPLDRSLSTVLGTDKNSGLAVYDLAGNQLQFLAAGRLNNVDLRYAFPLGGTEVALVTAGERDTNQIRIYAIDQTTRLLRDVAARPITTGLSEVHGSCMYTSALTGQTYFFGTSKDGDMEQWRLFGNANGRVDAQLVRTFTVGGQIEGCVADDETGYLFVSEEDVGIWRYGAEPGAGTVRIQIDTTGAGGHLTPDVEGLTIYQAGGGAGYLLASSQGDSSYAVYGRQPPHAFVTRFQIGANLGMGIDDVTGTDGIEVANLGLGGSFPAGVFVVQDEVNPGGNQNFKLVPWPAIAAAANPPLLVDSTYDAHGTCVGPIVLHRNGSGVNPMVLTNLRPARLGALWECELDCSGHAPDTAQVFGYSRGATGPIFVSGELLVDLSSTYYFTLSAIHLGNAVRFQAFLPNDITLCGRLLSIQGLCRGAPAPRLSNAIDLRVGR
jgi:PKD repeat protein